MSTEKEEHLARLAAEATHADRDTEDQLVELFEIVISRREDPAEKRRYEGKRDEMVQVLAEHGPRYFIDAEGNKRYAYVVAPESVEVDLDELEAAHAEGKISDQTLEDVAPRKIDKEEFRKAVSRGDIDPATFVRVATIVQKTRHVGFSDPIV